MYLTLGRPGGAIVGYTWRVWSSRTSFYLTSRDLAHDTVEAQSSRRRSAAPAGRRVQVGDGPEDAFERDIAANKIVGVRVGGWPLRSSGSALTERAILVLRFRWTWDAIIRLGPAPPAGALRVGATGLAIPPPPKPGDAVDVDFVVSRDEPYWLNEKRARKDNACLGPLRNDSGVWLTGTVVKRWASHYPPPPTAVGPRPANRDDQLRAVAAAADSTGFVWLIEQRMSRSALTDASKSSAAP